MLAGGMEMGSGVYEAAADGTADNPDPKIATRDPGAIPWPSAKLAALTTPPVAMVGCTMAVSLKVNAETPLTDALYW